MQTELRLDSLRFFVVVNDAARDLLEAEADSKGFIILEESLSKRIVKRQNRITFTDLEISHIKRDNCICHEHCGFFIGNFQIVDEISAFIFGQTVHPDVPDFGGSLILKH